MRALRRLAARLANLFRRRRLEREMEHEMCSIFEHMVDDHLTAGLDEKEARRRARLALGIEQTKEAGRDAHLLRWLDDAARDTKLALRGFRRTPLFVCVALATLAIGIGANATIFAMVDALLLRPLDFPEPERLVSVQVQRPPDDPLKLSPHMVSGRMYEEWTGEGKALSAAAATRVDEVTVTGQGEPLRLQAAYSTPSLFPLLGARVERGRLLETDDVRQGRADTALLSHDVWIHEYGGSPDIVGATLTIDERPYTIVGVLDPAFTYPSRYIALWIPESITTPAPGAFPRYYRVVARLAPGVAPDQAAVEGQTFYDRQPKIKIGGTVINASRIRIVPLAAELVGSTRPTLLVLFGAVGAVLLIATVNLANLLLLRATARDRELAVRSALGAGSWRLIRQLLTESTLLCIGGGALGTALAYGLLRLLRVMLSPYLPRSEEIALDPRVLLFTVALSLGTGLLSGIVPALQGTRFRRRAQLCGARATHPSRIRAALTVAEVSLALMLLIFAGLSIRSFVVLLGVDPGFDAHGVLTAGLTLPESRYQEPERRLAFFSQLLERITALPGVEAAGLSSSAPLGVGRAIVSMKAGSANDLIVVQLQPVSADFFRAMGMRLLAGRWFSADEERSASEVIVVNQTFAQQHLGTKPIGSIDRSVLSSGPEVIGVVQDVLEAGRSSEPTPTVYVPLRRQVALRQQSSSFMAIALRTTQPPSSIASALRSAVHELDPLLPIEDLRTMESAQSEEVTIPRVLALALGAFAAVAALLAGIGIYGVVAHGVRQRQRELGVRRALGAGSGRIVAESVRGGAALVGAGVALGMTGAFFLSRLLENRLFGISARDPTTFLVVPVILVAVALSACLLPAWRATRVDPVEVLRSE